MHPSGRQHLLAEQTFLQRELTQLPVSARLTRMSLQARLDAVVTLLASLPPEERAPARATLTFNGQPVVGSHGIFADFGMKAVGCFTDAVASVAASMAAPLPAMGPIPNRAQYQLLVVGTAVGSFGFELEEYRTDPQLFLEPSPVANALGRTQALLKSTMGDDEALADLASETDSRALDKIRNFLKVLADNEAICALSHAGTAVRFRDVGQVKSGLARLAADNLKEEQVQLKGAFVGVLPNSRSFEFQLQADNQVVRGKIAPQVQQVEEINRHLLEPVRIEVVQTQVGNGRPRFRMVELPVWVDRG